MCIKKILAISTISLFLISCNSTSEKLEQEVVQNTSSENTSEILGINVEEDSTKSESFSPVPSSNYYYGQLLIDTTLYKDAVDGPDARKLMNYVMSLFGSEKKQFGLSVVPKLNNIKLPEIIVFSYKYDSENNYWSSSLNRKYRSPAISLTSLSELEFEFKYVASNENNVAIAESIAEIVSGYSGISPGSWSISQLSESKVKEAASNVDRIISGIISDSITTNVTDKLEPVTDGTKSITYLAKESDSTVFAEIEFSVRLITSLVSGQVMSDQDISSNYSDSLPSVDPFTNPLNRIRVDGQSDDYLREMLIKDGKLKDIVAAIEPDEFKQVCRNILDTLESDYGLNIVDRLNAFSHVLRLTNFLRDQGLYNSGCLHRHELELLKKIGIGLDFENNFATTPLDHESLIKLAGFFKSPVANIGFKPDILNMFASHVRVSSGTDNLKVFDTPMAVFDRQTLLERFSNLKAARVCCWDGNVKDSEGVPDPLSKPILFRTLLTDTLYVLELYHNSKDLPVSFMQVREISPDEIADVERLALLAPAKINVEDYELDIMRR